MNCLDGGGSDRFREGHVGDRRTAISLFLAELAPIHVDGVTAGGLVVVGQSPLTYQNRGKCYANGQGLDIMPLMTCVKP